MTAEFRHAPWFAPPGFGELPVGALVAFAGRLGVPVPNSASPQTTYVDSPPETEPMEAWGWMLCDGRTLSVYLYPELFAALGYLYGGSGDSFFIPDYRGYFWRGVDAGAGVDPDVGMRSPPAGSRLPGDVGSQQPFALQDHEHTYLFAQTTAAPAQSGDAAGAPLGSQKFTQGGPVNASPPAAPVQVSPNETRPANIYVNYLIKFTYGLRPSLR
jgi:microcystin-dependent protein